LEKVDFIERSKGMALLNSHPDYLREPAHLAIYEAFLKAMRQRGKYWHALPRDVALWWRQRAALEPHCRDGKWDLTDLPGATVSYLTA
jgi:hypothetical protein